MSKFIHVRNPAGGWHPANAVAEFSFGKMCDDHYRQIKEAQPVNTQRAMDMLLQIYEKAIEFGLTYKMSKRGDPLMDEIFIKAVAAVSRGKNE